jgi:hypothetical protein
MDLVYNADIFNTIMQHINGSIYILQNLFLAHKIFQQYISKIDTIKVCDEHHFMVNGIIFLHIENVKKIVYQNDDVKNHKLLQDIRVFSSIPPNVTATDIEYVNIECNELFISHTHMVKSITRLTLNGCCCLSKGIFWYREIINPCITNNITYVCLCNMELEIIMFINVTIQSKITKLKIKNIICIPRSQLRCTSDVYKNWELYSLPSRQFKSIEYLEITMCNMNAVNDVFSIVLNYLQKCESIIYLIFTYNNQNIDVRKNIFPISLKHLDLRGNNILDDQT